MKYAIIHFEVNRLIIMHIVWEEEFLWGRGAYGLGRMRSLVVFRFVSLFKGTKNQLSGILTERKNESE